MTSTDSALERAAADMWRADNPTASVFSCDSETKNKYRRLALTALGIVKATTPKIRTDYWRKPGPTDKHDWFAWYDGDEPNDNGSMASGEGATEAEAIAELVENHPREAS